MLGDDLADPYCGAFKISRGLSSRFPGRVISTPISESALLGDFIALAFDQLLNFTAKSVTMFGLRVPLPSLSGAP